jgi:multiple antibiotic resistance protein
MNADLFARVFVTALVILDPVGNVPTFLSLTRTTPHRRSHAALQATLVAAVVILLFALFGEQVLDLLSISVESLQVSGGLVLVLVALELLGTASGSSALGAGGNAALVPLGTPLLAGPGAIAAAMVYMRGAGDAADRVAVAAALLAALLVVYVGLRFAALLARVLRDSGIELLSRIVGLVLGAIAVQLVAEGIDACVRHGVR